MNNSNTVKLNDSISCIATFALIGQHTNPTGHNYDICSNKRYKQFKFFPRRRIADASPYIRKEAKFIPILSVHSNYKLEDCSYFHWTRGVGYVICPFTSELCSLMENTNVDFNLRSALDGPSKCQNPVSINFTTHSAALRRKVLPPVDLSVCIYSGFRPHKNTRFHNLLEANIEYHRKLGVQRFYILDRNYSHKDLFDRHKSDWIDTKIVHYTSYTAGELLNPKSLLPGGSINLI